MNERVQLTHSNKPNNPKRTIVTNRPSTEASKPWPRHTVLPARDIRPLAGIGEEVEERCVGVEEDRESRGEFVKEFVLDSREREEEEKEGEGEREDVEMVYGANVDDIPEVGDEEMPQEHVAEGAESDGVPDAQRLRIIGAESNLERRKAKSDITNGVVLVSGSNQTFETDDLCRVVVVVSHEKNTA